MEKLNGFEIIENYKGFLIVKGQNKKYSFLEPKEKGGYFTRFIDFVGNESDTLKDIKNVISNLAKV
jgi:hypothetical protein